MIFTEIIVIIIIMIFQIWEGGGDLRKAAWKTASTYRAKPFRGGGDDEADADADVEAPQVQEMMDQADKDGTNSLDIIEFLQEMYQLQHWSWSLS